MGETRLKSFFLLVDENGLSLFYDHHLFFGRKNKIARCMIRKMVATLLCAHKIERWAGGGDGGLEHCFMFYFVSFNLARFFRDRSLGPTMVKLSPSYVFCRSHLLSF